MDDIYHDKKLLKRFLKENFNFSVLRKAGVFTKEMRFDYVSQANKICHMFGYNTVYEYGSEDFSCHITYTEDVSLMKIGGDGELKSAPFITRHEGHKTQLKKAIENEDYKTADYYKKIIKAVEKHKSK